MEGILEKLRVLDPNNNDAVKDTLSALFQKLSHPKQGSAIPYLRAIESVLNRYPKFCISHRNAIETYLTHYLDCKDYQLVIETAKCLHSIQQVRPLQEKSASPKSSWREHMELLCNTAHRVVNAIFTDAVDLYKKGTHVDTTSQVTCTTPASIAISQLSDLGANTKLNNNKKTLLSVRLRNLFVFIQAMLVEVYPVAKPIRPHVILELIIRTLSVSSGSNNKGMPAQELINIKMQALRTLDALILCLGSNLIPYSPLVFRIVMQTLRWSSENDTKENRQVRIQAYSTLSQWLETLHCHKPTNNARDASKSWQDELVSHVILDVTPVRHQVTLTMSSQPTKHLSKKAKRKLANSMLQDSGISSHMPGEKNKISNLEEDNEEVALAALNCLETFLIVCGVFLKPLAHKVLQERLVRECYSPHSPKRLLSLLTCLEAARKSAPTSVNPPSQYCLDLYAMLGNHRDGQISSFCTRALLDIRLHLHCSPPSFSFALENNNIPAEEKTRNVSERNKAALQSLLGDRYPQTNGNSEVIITIGDEPSNKKPRISDDDNDKISLSDENSVDISDESEPDDKKDAENEAVIDLEEVDDVQVTEDITVLEDDSNDKEMEEQTVTEVPSQNNIHEAKTQQNVDISNDTLDGHEVNDSQCSVEVAYDYPSTGKDKVTVLEKLEDENLPSSNETDDIQITCGQKIINSQDNSQKKIEEVKVDVKINGSDEFLVKVNGDASMKENIPQNDVISNIPIKEGIKVSVEEMLADFVDEVVEIDA